MHCWKHLGRSHWSYGVQRICSFPFGPDDTFHGKNCRPTVFVIPPKQFNTNKTTYKNFEFKGLHHAKRLWVGRVELLFTCSFKEPCGLDIPCELALVSFLYPFNVPEAMEPLQWSSGCTLYYCPKQHWYHIVPIQRIIGRFVFLNYSFPWGIHVVIAFTSRAPLMPCYLDGGVTGTIPSGYAHYKTRYFSNGTADNWKRLGSLIFELNTFAWRFGRPMPELPWENEQFSRRIQYTMNTMEDNGDNDQNKVPTMETIMKKIFKTIQCNDTMD